MARVLTKKLESAPAHLTELEGGLCRFGLDPPASRRPGSRVDLRARGPILCLIYEHLQEQARVLEIQHPHAWEDLSPEGVHQMRIASRRIRGTLRNFKRMLPHEMCATFNVGFRWFANALGQVRDLDVYTENYRRYVTGASGLAVDVLRGYERHLEAERKKKTRESLLAALSRPRYRDLMASFSAFVQQGPSPTALGKWGDLSPT